MGVQSEDFLGKDRDILFEISKLSQSGHELTFRVSRWSRLKGWQEGRGLKEGRMQNEKPMPEKKTGYRRGRGVIVGGKGRGGGGGCERGRGGKENVVVMVVARACVCRTRLCNPFRESAERGTQTPEWGKNSVSSPLPSTLFLCLQVSSLAIHPRITRLSVTRQPSQA